jgi:hypothetical protein
MQLHHKIFKKPVVPATLQKRKNMMLRRRKYFFEIICVFLPVYDKKSSVNRIGLQIICIFFPHNLNAACNTSVSLPDK